jgi:hypothetical protein
MQKPTQLVIAESAWHKSSLSGHAGNCVEVAKVDGYIAVRDSKNKAQQPLIFTKDEWRAFLGGVELREFDVKE